METVTRHRGGMNDHGRPLDEDDESIVVREVEPLEGREIVRRGSGRSARTFTVKLYTLMPVDIKDGDEVTVRGVRYPFVSVSEWRATGRRFSGRVILCGGGSG
ncbi:hypothetical protein [Gordonia sp. MMO-8]|uniref:hypothetical protein n=1 Tax=Gordonia sp. MMO-8 TaxID=3127886 RepID=UPI0030197DCD